MKILSIAKMIILRNLRDINIMLIMCAMPLVIIFVLGLAFDSQIGSDSNIELEDMEIKYVVIGEETELSSGIKTMMDDLLSEDSIYEKAEDKDEELEKLKANHITAFVEINETDQNVKLYKNDRVNTSSSIVETALRSYTARYNVIVEIAKINPMALQQVLADNEGDEYIQKVGLNEKYSPSAMDYYGVVIAILFVLYGFLTPLEQIIGERGEGLVRRVSTTSVKPVEKFVGNTLGYVAITTIRVAIVIAISAIFYDINWGSQPVYPFLLIFALTVTMTALGMLLGELFKSINAANTAGHLFIVVSAFFGGAYMALEDMGNVAAVGKYFSLIWWANTGVINQIYSGDYTNMKSAFIIFTALTVLFLGISVVVMNRKEAYSNG